MQKNATCWSYATRNAIELSRMTCPLVTLLVWVAIYSIVFLVALDYFLLVMDGDKQNQLLILLHGAIDLP